MAPIQVKAGTLLLILVCAFFFAAAAALLARAALALPDDVRVRRARAAFRRLSGWAWLGAAFTALSAALSVAHVIIAIPLSAMGAAVILAQALSATLSLHVHGAPESLPGMKEARRAFSITLALGLALPVLVLIAAAVMIGGRI